MSARDEAIKVGASEMAHQAANDETWEWDYPLGNLTAEETMVRAAMCAAHDAGLIYWADELEPGTKMRDGSQWFWLLREAT